MKHLWAAELLSRSGLDPSIPGIGSEERNGFKKMVYFMVGTDPLSNQNEKYCNYGYDLYVVLWIATRLNIFSLSYKTALSSTMSEYWPA